MYKNLTIASILTFALIASAFAMTQNALVADPEHYTLELENDQVRIVRIKYGPGEKSVMHSHGASVAVALTDANFSMTLPDGTVLSESQSAGDATWADAGEHLPENLSDEAAEVLLIELK